MECKAVSIFCNFVPHIEVDLGVIYSSFLSEVIERFPINTWYLSDSLVGTEFVSAVFIIIHNILPYRLFRAKRRVHNP
jgi:hypothetical protein